MVCHPQECHTWKNVSNPQESRSRVTPRFLVALPPEGSKAQEQDGSGMFVSPLFVPPTYPPFLTPDSDDDIIMPEGPPPGVEEEPVDSDDDIPMPEGPPPGKEQGVYGSIK